MFLTMAIEIPMSAYSLVLLNSFPQQELGVHKILSGVLFDVALRDFVKPADHFLFEPMHIFTGNGLTNLEMALCAQSMQEKIGKSWGEWHRFVTELPWSFPAHQWPTPSERAEWFGGKRGDVSNAKGHYVGDSSSILASFRILRFYMQDLGKLHPAMKPEVTSFDAMCELLEFMFTPQTIQPWSERPPARLQVLMDTWVAAHTTAYPENSRIPKFHWALHLVKQYRRVQHLLNAHTLERKHQTAKDIANSVPLGEHFDSAITKRFLHRQARSLKEPTERFQGRNIFNEVLLPQATVNGVRAFVLLYIYTYTRLVRASGFIMRFHIYIYTYIYI